MPAGTFRDRISRRSFLRATVMGSWGLSGLGHSQTTSDASSEPRPLEAVGAVLEAFTDAPLVAIGEVHGWQELHDFVQRLIQHPEFARRVGTIVVEFGNARYQSLVDRFVAGYEPISMFELRKVWRNTTQAAWFTWDHPVYAAFFRTVRAVNRARPPGQASIRVLLGDPALDWQTADFSVVMAALDSRDRHFADVVSREVLERNRRALLIAGYGHTVRSAHLFFLDNLISQLDQRFPRATLTVLPYAPVSSEVQRLEARLTAWQSPSLARLGDDWLGRTSASGVLQVAGINATLAEVADAYLYLGPGREMTVSQVDPAVFRDPAFVKELRRRRRLLGVDNNAHIEKLETSGESNVRLFPDAKR